MADLDWGSAAVDFSRKGPAPAGGGSVMDKYRVLTDPSATLPGEPVPVPTPLPTDRGAAYRTAVAGNLRQGRMPEGEISAAEYAKMPWSEYLPRVAENVVPSTQKALEGFASAVMNPIDTATTIGEIGYGLGSKGVGAVGQALGYDIDPAAKADREMMADALIENYKGRYGGGEEGQFWKSLAEDPMSYAADVASVASLGAGSATKLGPVSKLATNLDPVQAALNITGKAATTVGKLPPYALMAAQSAASGVPLKTLNIAREVGLSRDPAKVSAFMTALKGNPNFTGDVATAMEKAIDDMAEEASNAYMTSQSTAFARSQPVDMTGPTVARDTLYDMLNPNTVLRAPITYKPSDIQAANDAIFQIDSALTHPSDAGRTIQELDVIKKNIDKLTRQIDDPSLRGRVNDVAASLVNSMADTDPAYGDMMRGWQEYKHQLNNVRKDFGSERLSDAAKARKIARAFNSKYGNEMFSKLEGTPSGRNLRYSIAGDAMGELIGDRAHTAIAGLGGPLAALAFGVTHPAVIAAAIPGALASSPKLGAYSQYALGRAERAINDPISRARGYITAPVSNVASQVGSAVDEREGRKAGGRVGMPHEAAADQLVMAAERAKKGISKGTESLLDMSDNHIAHALEVANRSI